MGAVLKEGSVSHLLALTSDGMVAGVLGKGPSWVKPELSAGSILSQACVGWRRWFQKFVYRRSLQESSKGKSTGKRRLLGGQLGVDITVSLQGPQR